MSMRVPFLTSWLALVALCVVIGVTQTRLQAQTPTKPPSKINATKTPLNANAAQATPKATAKPPAAKKTTPATAKTTTTTKTTTKPAGKPKVSVVRAARAKTSAKSSAKTPAKTRTRDAQALKKPLARPLTPKSQTVTALFAVSQNRADAALDPIVLIKNGKYLNPPAGSASDARLRQFADQYYRPGQKYRLLFGGGEAGSVTVKQWNRKRECSRTEASATINGETAIKGRVMGLATNSDALGKRRRSRRAPTAEERAAIEALAARLYRQKGIADNQLAALRTINMTATDLNGDRRAEIIGTFLLKRASGGKSAHILFLIAEPQGRAFKAAFTQYGQITAKDVGSTAQFDELGESALAEVLVDQIDLDRDGFAEVIIADLTREGVAYKIFQKQRQGWRKAYEFYNYRCAN